MGVLSWRIQTNKELEHITTKGFINLKFLQMLSHQKPFWDKARLSSLVNKRFGGEGVWTPGEQNHNFCCNITLVRETPLNTTLPFKRNLVPMTCYSIFTIGIFIGASCLCLVGTVLSDKHKLIHYYANWP